MQLQPLASRGFGCAWARGYTLGVKMELEQRLATHLNSTTGHCSCVRRYIASASCRLLGRILRCKRSQRPRTCWACTSNKLAAAVAQFVCGIKGGPGDAASDCNGCGSTCTREGGSTFGHRYRKTQPEQGNRKQRELHCNLSENLLASLTCTCTR